MPTRRRFLQYGLAAGATLIPCSASARELVEPAAAFCALEPTAARASTPATFTPFVRDLPLLTPAAPQRSDRTGDHYTFAAREADVEILPGVSTRVLTYDGRFPGPTIRARRDRPVSVTVTNELAGRETSVHLHGGHVRPGDDGHPLDLIVPGASRTYRYPNRQRASTLWYHDHAMHLTGEQVYRGLAGLYLLTDEEAEAGLGLPPADRDIPLLLQDRAFDADGALVYDHTNRNGFRGDVMVVNGVAHPRLAAAATTYRFRVVNGSNVRTYRLALDSGQPLVQIASDGGLLPAPVSATSLSLAPAERAEVVVDLSGLRDQAVHLINQAPDAVETPLLRIEVGGAGAAPAKLAGALSAVERLQPGVRTRHVSLDLDATTGDWLINGKRFDEARVDFFPRIGTVEDWVVENTTNMLHPLHLHLVMFQVVDRIGGPPAPSGEAGWKDTVQIRPREKVRLRARFDGYTGLYVYHCHVLEHEDHVMMAQFHVTGVERIAGAGRFETAAAVSADTFDPGVPVAFVADGGGFADALSGGPAAAALGGPVLLNAGSSLQPATAAELTRLAPERIVVLGGSRVVPDSVVSALAAHTSGRVERWAGPSRFDTAARISREVFQPGVPVVYVATGADYPDALAGGAAAAAQGGPVLLVTRDGVPAATAEELSRLRPGRIVVLGGSGAVAEPVLAELRRFTGGPVERVAGTSRFETAASLSSRTFASPADAVFVATGLGYADALAGVPAAARAGAPLLLVTRDAIPAATQAELTRLQPRRIVVLGGRSVVADELVAALEASLPG